MSEELISKQGKEDLERSRRVLELTDRFEKNMTESIDDVVKFRKEFYAYKEGRESEIRDLDDRYGKLTIETLERVNKFEETITLNIGKVLGDMQDLKLQLTAQSVTRGSGAANTSGLQGEMAVLKQ